MTNSEIYCGVESVILTYTVKDGPIKITEGTNLSENLGINSARMVDIVLDLEDKFKISIPDSDMEQMNTVGEIVTLIYSLCNGAS
ncbi:acyl carrier protein [Acidisarcina polymorpha]|uniref:acyl carrier protein n=1 Tax=Acidisarcina polymorpha TaxID=2211140 RepID=UPI000DEFC22E|nr:acyl carrier protein [Acidisarcina polymorpha]